VRRPSSAPSAATAAAAALALLISPAARANVVGVDAQNFNATTNGLDFVTVQSSKTLTPGIFNVGLFVNHAVNTLPVFKSSAGRRHHRDSVTGADVNLGVGLMSNWDLGISVPQILKQTVDSDAVRGEFEQTGVTEARLNTKIRLWGGATYGIAVVGSVSQNLIEDNPYVGENPGPSTTGELVGDLGVGPVAMALNLGYRWRNPGDPVPGFPLEPFRNQYIYSAAASYLLPGLDTKVIAEIFGSRPAKPVSYDADRSQSSAEALLGLKHDLTTNVALHLGGGTELVHGVASPDWRAYAGVNIAFGPVFNDEPVVKRDPVRVKPAKQAAASTPPAEETFIMSNVMFAFDSSRDVLPGTKKELAELVTYLKRPPAYKRLVIAGHTDSVGTDEYNQKLSQERADTIKLYLVKALKLPASSIEAIGYGESRPISDNGNYQGRQLNRRVEFTIYRE
jgi:outer membrane protein OmpA-like peptidoglycan-associated protein